MVATNARCWECSNLPKGQKCEHCMEREQADQMRASAEDGKRSMSVNEMTGYLTAIAWLHRPGIKAASYRKDDGSEVTLYNKNE